MIDDTAGFERARPAEGHKPRLLFLSQTLPFPPNGGVKVRTYNILRLLAREFEIHALCFYRWKRGRLGTDVNAGIDGLRSFGEVQAFPIPQEHDSRRLLWDHARSVLVDRAYTVYTYESRTYAAALEKLLQEQTFDLVHTDSLDLSGYFPLLQGIPVVCTHHDAQSRLLRRRAERESRMLGGYLRKQALLTEKEERRWCPQVALNVCVSELDAAYLRNLTGSDNFTVVPNGVDVDQFTPSDGQKKGIVFVGGTTWFPNRDALTHFSEDIYPKLRARFEGVTTTWVGRATKEEVRQLSSEGLQLTGYVPDIRPYVSEAACYVVPIRIGGGTRIKILDAWAMGKAVVSTSIGCEGLDAVDGTNILIRDAPDEFASAIQEILTIPELRRKLETAGRKTAEQKYSWEVIGNNLIREYRTLCGRPAGAVSAQQPGLRPFTPHSPTAG